jgi:pyruvate,orthophosphate dikinase
MPQAYKQLDEIQKRLEKHYKDMLDIEFTIEDKKLWLLQCRVGKRNGIAAVQIALDMVKEKLITKEEAILRIDPNQLNQLLHKQFDQKALAKAEPVAQGLPASPGAAVGEIVFNASDALLKTEKGLSVVLVRTETSPEDIVGMVASQGILTARGGMTSHAAVVARGMGKCCVAGAGEIVVNEHEKTLIIKGNTMHE